LALTGHEAEAREELQQHLALGTIAALKAYNARITNARTDPSVLESRERMYDGLRKAGMPEE
jgi:hypothetical protein